MQCSSTLVLIDAAQSDGARPSSSGPMEGVRETGTLAPPQGRKPSMLQATSSSTLNQLLNPQPPRTPLSVESPSSLSSVGSARAPPAHRTLAPSQQTRSGTAGKPSARVPLPGHKPTASTKTAAMPPRNTQREKAILPQQKHLPRRDSQGILPPTEAKPSASAPPKPTRQEGTTEATPLVPSRHGSASAAQGTTAKDKADASRPPVSQPYHHHKLPNSRSTSPPDSGSTFHHHRMAEAASSSGTRDEPVSFEAPVWEGGRRHSLATLSMPLPTPPSFDHVPLRAPLPRRSSDIPVPDSDGQRPTLPPWDTLVRTRKRTKTVKQPGPTLAPIGLTLPPIIGHHHPPPEPQHDPSPPVIDEEDEEEDEEDQRDPSMFASDRPRGVEPPEVTIPLRPEETAGRWLVDRNEESRPGTETFELWPPPPPPPPPPPAPAS